MMSDMCDQLVLVTGASGYIGSHVIKELQVAGYRVRGTVRSLKIEEKVAPLRQLVPDARHPLELVEADLTQDKGWDQAVAGCWAVMHVASHLPHLTDQILEEEFMATTVGGVMRVLRASAAAGVKKMIITGSFTNVNCDPVPYQDKSYTEDDWTDLNHPNLSPYGKSKTMAEKAAWDFVRNLPDSKRMDLTVLLPTLVLGPPLLRSHGSTGCVGFINMILNRTYPGMPHIINIIVDVRDVAKAHVQCLTTPEVVGQRILLHSHTHWAQDLSRIISKEFSSQGYRVYTNKIPYVAFWFLSFFNSKIEELGLLGRIGTKYDVSNEKMKRIFNMTPIEESKTIIDMVYAMIDLGITYKAKNYRKTGSRTTGNST
uniref:NADPH-dependent aldehyde reductase ARI1-like n=1 Tax=Hirondellea gigas TaxID=1518452 RepID=A0A2P2I0J4_9CRUS